MTIHRRSSLSLSLSVIPLSLWPFFSLSPSFCNLALRHPFLFSIHFIPLSSSPWSLLFSPIRFCLCRSGRIEEEWIVFLDRGRENDVRRRCCSYSSPFFSPHPSSLRLLSHLDLLMPSPAEGLILLLFLFLSLSLFWVSVTPSLSSCLHQCFFSPTLFLSSLAQH